MLGSPILYLKGMRIMMFQLSGFYCIRVPLKEPFKGTQPGPYRPRKSRTKFEPVRVQGVPPMAEREAKITLRLVRGSWAFWGRVSALGPRVWDLTRRVQEH